MLQLDLLFEHTPADKWSRQDLTVRIDLDDTANNELLLDKIRVYQRGPDCVRYDKPYDQMVVDFIQQAQQAKTLFGFDWDLNNLTQENFNLWHRDIETFNLQDHPPWTKEKGNFFVDLHYLLHAVEPNKGAVQPRPNESVYRHRLQIKWYENSFDWTQQPEFLFYDQLRAGDVIADYPHVGKDPFFCMLHNEKKEDLPQCCKLPDCGSPGILILLVDPMSIDRRPTWYQDSINATKRRQLLTDWYQQNAEVLAPKFSLEKMFKYDGEYRLGRLANLDQLENLRTANLHSVRLA